MSSTHIIPFTVDIPLTAVNRLWDKIHATRQPNKDVVPEASSDYGFPSLWALDMRDYWPAEYSWQEAERRMNRRPHFPTELNGINVHFVHQRSTRSDAVPLLMIHGWPGSFYEFNEVLDPLCTDNDDGPVFHCVVPSLPGFCFPPRHHDGAGDWGQFVARELGANPVHANACKLVHLNYCPGALPENLNEAALTDREKAARDKGVGWRTNHVGYAVLMRTRPHTVGWMLQDNPIGLLVFVGEKYHEACNPKVHDTIKWREHVITTVCLYYFTHCIMSSTLIYYENLPHHLFAAYAMEESNKIRYGFGYTSYWFDTAPNSRRAVERTGRLVLYKERDYASHSACLEDPDGIVEDVRDLIGEHWTDPSR